MNGYIKCGMIHQQMECYMIIKMNEVLLYVKTWMNLGKIMVTERSSHKKLQNYDSIYMKSSRIDKSTETENKLVVQEGDGNWREMGSDCKWIQGLFLG